MTDTFRKNIGALGCTEPSSWHNKYHIKQKWVFSFFSTCPENIFSVILEKPKLLEPYADFKAKNFGRVVQIAFYVSWKTPWKKYFVFFWIFVFLDLERKNFSTVVKIVFYVSGETFWINKFLRKKSFFFGILVWKVLVGLSDLHSTCPEEHFGVAKKFKPEHFHFELENQGENVYKQKKWVPFRKIGR